MATKTNILEQINSNGLTNRELKALIKILSNVERGEEEAKIDYIDTKAMFEKHDLICSITDEEHREAIIQDFAKVTKEYHKVLATFQDLITAREKLKIMLKD